jgi:phosphoribosylformylglycinamidine cyclo-ligase
MAQACRDNGCALLGGETAQLPDLYAARHMDLAGTVVGVVERAQLITGEHVTPGDRVWGLPSTGLHTNGYSLARRILAEHDELAEALLAPHPSYLRAMEPLLPNVKAIAHITGGGIPGNLPRVLPDHVSVQVQRGAWPVPPIFELLQERGHIEEDEMWRVFNMGLGLMFVTAPDVHCPGALEVGRVIPRTDQRVIFK